MLAVAVSGAWAAEPITVTDGGTHEYSDGAIDAPTMFNAVYVSNGSTVFLNDDIVDTSTKMYGLYASGNSSLTVGLPSATSVEITTDFPVQKYAATTPTASVYANDSDITVNSVGTITLSSTNANHQAAGVYLNTGSTVTIGGSQTQSVDVTATSIATTRDSGDASTWGKTTSALWSEGGSLSLYGQKITLKASSAKSQTIGVFAKNSGVIGLHSSGEQSKIRIVATSEQGDGGDYQAAGVYSSGSAQINIGDATTNKVHIEAKSSGTSRPNGFGDVFGNFTTGVWSDGGAVAVDGKILEILAASTNSQSFGVFAKGRGAVTIGSDSTASLLIDADGQADGNTGGLYAYEGGQISVKAEEVRIESTGDFGIRAQNNTPTATTEPVEGAAAVYIDAGTTTIINDDAAIMAFSNGIVDIKGNLYAKADSVIDTRGYSTININQGGNATVVLEGDIAFETPGAMANSGEYLDSNININLTGEGSSWTGCVERLYLSDINDDEDAGLKTTVTGLNVRIADGAKWNATVFQSVEFPDANATYISTPVSDVELDGGIINSTAAGQQIDVVNLKVAEQGGTFNAVTKVAEDGTLTTAQLVATTLGTTAENTQSRMRVNYQGIDADTLASANPEDLKGFTAGETTSDVTVEEYVKEGNIRGAWTRTNGEGAGSYADNTKLESFRGVNAVALVQWRNQINHLTKRLGDVRHQSGDIGAWARVYGGEYEWGDANRVDMQTTTVQVGGDARMGDWIVGGAFSYSDSSYDLDNGEGDGDLYSLAVYGTRMFEKGSYVDFVARYGYIKNDIQAGNMGVDFDSNAFSLSVEGGHTFKFMERAYVEPQIEFTYGFAQGDDATASNGVKIEQDDYQNLITRIGFRTGFDFPNEAGTIYAHASYSYDFLGEVDGTASQNGLHASLDEDLGGGWVTYGIGGQFRLGESTFAYGELERSTGGDVDNPWAFNVGLRHLF